MHFKKSKFCFSLAITLWGLIACCTPNAEAGLITLASTTPDPIAPGGTVNFDVDFTDSPDAGDNIISITLNFAASDASLTAGGTDFSAFSFVPDPNLALNGWLSFSFDPVVSDDGIVTLDADTPPFGFDTGIPDDETSVRLGTLSVVAPTTPGDYAIDFLVDNDPFASGTSLLLDDFLTVLTPNVQGANFTVTSAATVPEPSSLLLFGCVGGCLLFRRRRQRHNCKADAK